MQYLTGSPALNWTVGQLAYVNSTVLLLEGAMANATTKLNGAVDQINAFFGSSPTPSQMATQMTTAAAGIDTSSGTTLSNNMNTAGTNFQNLTPRFYAPDVTPYRTFIANIRWVAQLGEQFVQGHPECRNATSISTGWLLCRPQYSTHVQ
jgi:hypothetical protein